VTETGCIASHDASKGFAVEGTQHEPGWCGETPYALFLTAWRSGDGEDYDNALRSAYFYTDVVIDHSQSLARMHGYPFGALAMPLNRVQGTLAAYLETGDPYLLSVARSVCDRAYAVNRTAWPRLAVGRDSCFGRSLVMLYRYFGQEPDRRRAWEVCDMVVRSQRADGSFGDQGGGTGVHGWAGYITKPWMGLLAINCVLDYLELIPDEDRFFLSVRRFADWLLAERVEHGGVLGWAYQHGYAGSRRFYEAYRGQWVDLPFLPGWHHETLARLLGYCSTRTADPSYLNAWAQSRGASVAIDSDYAASAALQFIPWLQMTLTGAHLDSHGQVTADPNTAWAQLCPSVRVIAPSGEQTVRLRKMQ
jgi:hypothetical protein